MTPSKSVNFSMLYFTFFIIYHHICLDFWKTSRLPEWNRTITLTFLSLRKCWMMSSGKALSNGFTWKRGEHFFNYIFFTFRNLIFLHDLRQVIESQIYFFCREHAAVLLEIFAKHESFMFISAWIEEPPSRWQVRLIDFDIQGDEKRNRKNGDEFRSNSDTWFCISSCLCLQF